MEGINISVSRVGARRDIALLKVRGYLDTQTCGTMHNEMTKILQDGFSSHRRHGNSKLC